MARLAALLLLAGCATLHGRLDWRRPDGSFDAQELNEDVYACEQRAAEDDAHDRDRIPVGARAWGGWGDFTFESCMQRKGWKLTKVGRDG